MPERRPSAARRADRYDLYQRSVQDPEIEIEFLDRAYRHANGRAPRVLREDFCGTFAVACAWARKPGRRAVAVDLDPEPLAWGRAHNLAALPPAARSRVLVRRRDVRTVADEKADVLAAENFSYWVFKTRGELRRYFEIARENLAPEGILVLDLMGGGECYAEGKPDRRRVGRFTYLWECARYDPITHDTIHHIHFEFPDGSRLRKAFTYDWRFWTLAEVREVLAEAGFPASTVWWERKDGEYRPRERGDCDPAWICYVTARRGPVTSTRRSRAARPR